MKRILIASAAVAMFSASTASACLVASDGDPVMHSDGGTIAAGSSSCATELDASVLFAVNSAVLTAAGMAALDAIDTSGVSTVTGYASTDGSDAYNLSLSEARAQAVSDYLGNGATVVGGGETSEFGDDLASNRVVVLS